LPKDKAAYHYIGSLTTPPCSEEVQWVVMKKRASVTKAQVSAISNRIGSNNRPVQPLNDREVVLTDI